MHSWWLLFICALSWPKYVKNVGLTTFNKAVPCSTIWLRLQNQQDCCWDSACAFHFASKHTGMCETLWCCAAKSVYVCLRKLLLQLFVSRRGVALDWKDQPGGTEYHLRDDTLSHCTLTDLTPHTDTDAQTDAHAQKRTHILNAKTRALFYKHKCSCTCAVPLMFQERTHIHMWTRYSTHYLYECMDACRSTRRCTCCVGVSKASAATVSRVQCLDSQWALVFNKPYQKATAVNLPYVGLACVQMYMALCDLL